MRSEQDIKVVLEGLQIQCAVVELVLIHLVARMANAVPQPDAWVRTLAAEVHASIDRTKQPHKESVQVMATALRDRLDRFATGAILRLDSNPFH